MRRYHMVWLSLFGGLSFKAVGDDGHLNALGLAQLAAVLLPVIVLLAVIFLAALYARFVDHSKKASWVLRSTGALLSLLSVLFLSLELVGWIKWIALGFMAFYAGVLYLDHRKRMSLLKK